LQLYETGRCLFPLHITTLHDILSSKLKMQSSSKEKLILGDTCKILLLF
jgi:hypothetical protein